MEEGRSLTPSLPLVSFCLLGKWISTHFFKDIDRDNIPKDILEEEGDRMS